MEDTIVRILQKKILTKKTKEEGIASMIPHIATTLMQSLDDNVTEEELERIVDVLSYEAGRIGRLNRVSFSPSSGLYPREEIEKLPSDVDIQEYDPGVENKYWDLAVANLDIRRNWTVLAVGDSAKQTKNLAETLSNTGYSVDSCTGEEISEKLAKYKDEQIVVVLGPQKSAKKVVEFYNTVKGVNSEAHFLSALTNIDDIAVLISQDIPHIFTPKRLEKDALVTRVDKLVNPSSVEYKRSEKRFHNHVIPLMGATSTGKSRIATSISIKMPRVSVARKLSTRPKRPGEPEVEAFKEGEYFARWNRAGFSYAFEKEIFQPFEHGEDLIIPVAAPEVFDKIIYHTTETYGDSNMVVPVMLKAEPREIRARFIERQGYLNEERRQMINEEVETYNNPEIQRLFYSIIINNAAFSNGKQSEDEIADHVNQAVTRLQIFLERLRKKPTKGMLVPQYHSQFVNEMVQNLALGFNSFEELKEASVSRKIQLTFNDDFIREYMNQNGFAADYMGYGKKRNVAGVWKSNGRGVIVLEAYHEKRNGLDPDATFFTGLLEKSLGRAWRKQQPGQSTEGWTPYGLIRCPNLEFIGGVHFALTDVFPFPTEDNLYSLDIVYASGDNIGEAVLQTKPLSPNELTRLRKGSIVAINRRIDDLYVSDM